MAHTISTDCTECGSCQPECPVNAIQEGSPFTISADLCTDCGVCVSVCPVDAIKAG